MVEKPTPERQADIDVRCDAALRVLWLHLKRTHVAHRAAGLGAWLAVPVLG